MEENGGLSAAKAEVFRRSFGASRSVSGGERLEHGCGAK